MRLLLNFVFAEVINANQGQIRINKFIKVETPSES